MRNLIATGLILGCSVAGCGPAGNEAGDSESAKEPEAVGTTDEALTRGTPIPTEEYTGIVALQVWSFSWGAWGTFCTGTLMTNDKVLTAKHCMAGMQGSPLRAKMGSQTSEIITPVHDAPDWDVTALKLRTPMTMWNWSVDHFLTSPPQKKTSGYARGSYAGTNASLNNASLMCYGYSGATQSRPQPGLTYGVLRATYNDGLQVTTEVHTHRNAQNQLQEHGDSGGPCLAGTSPYATPLALITSNCFGTATISPADYCGGPGAETWGFWAYLTLLSI